MAVVFAASAEYWIDHVGHLGSATRFRIGLPPGAREVRVGLTDEIEISGPIPSLLATSSTRLRYRIADREDGGISVVATVRAWGTSRDALKLTFAAAWHEPRSLGTCYLRLPDLTRGSSAAVPPAHLLEREIQRQRRQLTEALDRTGKAPSGVEVRNVAAEFVAVGRTEVFSGIGEVSTEASRRPPDDYLNGRATWNCRHVARTGVSAGVGRFPIGSRAPDQIFDDKGRVESIRSYRRSLQDQSGCAATAVLTGSSAGLARDMALIIISALASVGLGIVLFERLPPIATTLALALLAAIFAVFVVSTTTNFTLLFEVSRWLALFAGVGLLLLLVLALRARRVTKAAAD